MAEEGRTYHVRRSLHTEVSQVRIVEIVDKSCTCLFFQDQLVPCAHAIRVADEIGMSHYELFDWRFRGQTYKWTYNGRVVATPTSNLFSDECMLPPEKLLNDDESSKPGPKKRKRMKSKGMRS